MIHAWNKKTCYKTQINHKYKNFKKMNAINNNQNYESWSPSKILFWFLLFLVLFIAVLVSQCITPSENDDKRDTIETNRTISSSEDQ